MKKRHQPRLSILDGDTSDPTAPGCETASARSLIDLIRAGQYGPGGRGGLAGVAEHELQRRLIFVTEQAAWEAERSGRRLTVLTVALVALTVLLLAMTGVLVWLTTRL